MSAAAADGGAAGGGRGAAAGPPRTKKRACRSCHDDRRFCDTALPMCGRCKLKGVVCVYDGAPQRAATQGPLHRDPLPKPERRKIACVNCRASKRFCEGPEDGKDACEMCRTRGLVCVFVDRKTNTPRQASSQPSNSGRRKRSRARPGESGSGDESDEDSDDSPSSGDDFELVEGTDSVPSSTTGDGSIKSARGTPSLATAGLMAPNALGSPSSASSVSIPSPSQQLDLVGFAAGQHPVTYSFPSVPASAFGLSGPEHPNTPSPPSDAPPADRMADFLARRWPGKIHLPPASSGASMEMDFDDFVSVAEARSEVPAEPPIRTGWNLLGPRFGKATWLEDPAMFELFALYFDRYHPMLPIVHPHTFVRTYPSAHPLLLASVLLNGAIWALHPSVRDNRGRLEGELFALCRGHVVQLYNEAAGPPPPPGGPDRVPRWKMEALVGLVLLATWCIQAGMGKLGRGMYGVAFALVRRWKMDREPAGPILGSREDRVAEWIEREQRRRVTFQLVMLGSFARSVSHSATNMTYRDCNDVRMQCPFRVWDVLSARDDFEPDAYPPSPLRITDYTSWIEMDPSDPDRAAALIKLAPVFGEVTATVCFWALREEVDDLLERLKAHGLSPSTLPPPSSSPQAAELHAILERLRRTIADSMEMLPAPYRAAEERAEVSEVAPYYHAEAGHWGYCFLPILNMVQMRALRLELDTSFGVLPVTEMHRIVDEWWLGEKFTSSLSDAILYTRNLDNIMAYNPSLMYCGIGYVNTAFRIGCLHLAIQNRYRELLARSPPGSEAADGYASLIQDAEQDVLTCLNWLGTMADSWGLWIRELHRVFKGMVDQSRARGAVERGLEGSLAGLSVKEIEGLQAREDLVEIPLVGPGSSGEE
ncbi:hypothetical protein DFJ74DRAFT_774716 [Hyaloraphidium curvatum]|nr:hypothetical protein DFJ74DRAFT_774716 [Hyaloraphidium curvatum]